jgi:YggT family protein
LQIYLVVLTVRILMSWFRTIDWYAEPWNTLRQVGRTWFVC